MEDELYHFGIKGMHWGVRRYQNPDGTLTSAGKRRLKKLRAKEAKADRKARKAHIKIEKRAIKEAKRKAKEDQQHQEDIEKNRFNKMSNDELRDAIARMQLEKQYSQLVKDLTPESKASVGKKLVTSVLDKMATQTAPTLIDRALTDAGSKALTRYLNKKLGNDKGNNSRKLMSKSIFNLTDDELDKVKKRLQSEKDYSDMMKPSSSNSRELLKKNINDLTDKEFDMLKTRLDKQREYEKSKRDWEKQKRGPRNSGAIDLNDVDFSKLDDEAIAELSKRIKNMGTIKQYMETGKVKPKYKIVRGPNRK